MRREREREFGVLVMLVLARSRRRCFRAGAMESVCDGVPGEEFAVIVECVRFWRWEVGWVALPPPVRLVFLVDFGASLPSSSSDLTGFT